jgi:hypothetical protein
MKWSKNDKTSPNNLAVTSGNGKKSFTGNQHVQIENNPPSPQCQTKAEMLAPFRPT